MAFALLALGIIVVCLAMMVLGWTLDMVWIVRPVASLGTDVETKSRRIGAWNGEGVH